MRMSPVPSQRRRPKRKKVFAPLFPKSGHFLFLRLLACCALSVVLYVLAFAFWLDQPLSRGLMQTEILQKTQRLATLPSPKLLILAGSNADYSHSCVVIGGMLEMPCENAGMAVGIGLDELFRRDAPFLRRGDVVYLPMELAQYTASRAQYDAEADGFMLLRHDRALLAQLPPDRILGALFCCTLADALDALAEMALARHGISPQALLAREYNAEGDRIDNDLAGAMPDLLRHPPRAVPRAQDITQGYGASLIARFVAAEAARGVIVIGGLPTDFSTLALSDDLVRTIAGLYTAHGGVSGPAQPQPLSCRGFLQRRGPSGPALPVSAFDFGGERACLAAAPPRSAARSGNRAGCRRLPE
jgi:hypothetical protein